MTTAGADNRLAPGLDARDAAVLHHDLRRAGRPHLAAAGLDERTGRLGIDGRQGLQRNRHRGIDGVWAQHPRENAEEVRRGRLPGGLVERSQGQRLPQHVAQPARLAVADEPALDRFAVGRRQPAPAGLQEPLRASERGCQVERRQAIAPAEGVPFHDARQQVQRRRERRATERGERAGRIDERHLEAGLNLDAVARADTSEEGERLVVAAEHQVLAVVHRFASHRVGEGRRAASERWTRLEDERPHAGVAQRGRRAQPREASADHDDVDPVHSLLPSRSRQRPSADRAQMAAAITARRGRGTRIFPLKTS